MSARLAASIVALALVGSAGCARRNVIVIPAPPKPERVAQAPAAVTDDQAGRAGDASAPDDAPPEERLPAGPAPEAPPRPTDDAPGTEPADEQATPADPAAGSRPPAPAAPDAPPPAADEEPPGEEELHPALLDGESERLRAQTLRELDEAQKRIDELGERGLDEDEATQVERAAQFVTTARAALAKGDVRRAANLSRKAAVLLADLD